jgi:hypothetical protein
MSTIFIKYSKKQLRHNLIFGIIWILIFIGYLSFGSQSNLRYGYLIIGIFFLGNYLYQKIKHYLTIENGVLKKNYIFPKKISLEDIKEVRYFAGEYKLISNTNELIINTVVIDKTSLKDLRSILDNLKLSRK